jgi:hypothetical protein
MPYRQNVALITAVSVVAPVALSALMVLAAMRWRMHRKRLNRRPERESGE